MSTVSAYWQSSKAIVKLFIVGLIMLLLLIPTFMVSHLVDERKQRQQEATAEVSSKWGSGQNIAGPIMALPYYSTERTSEGKVVQYKKWAYLLPDRLDVQAVLQPQQRQRGIYKVMLYQSDVRLLGNFVGGQLAALGIDPAQVLWNEARMRFHITDLKGLNKVPTVTLNNKPYAATTGNYNGQAYLEVPLPAENRDSAALNFSATLNLNGTESFLITPVGKHTVVDVSSTWPHPSYTGSILPQPKKSGTDSTSPHWESFAHNRSFAQQWKDEPYRIGMPAIYSTSVGVTTTRASVDAVGSNDLGEAAFGLSLFMPVDNYQQTSRAVKYAILCIILTFAAVYLLDVINAKAVHPVQYALVGLALVLFYVLLLAIGEYLAFSHAYLIAAAATVGLIAWFMKNVLASGKLSLLLALTLSFVYSYLFTLLRLEDSALLVGSIGLFVTLAVIMHFSKRFSW